MANERKSSFTVHVGFLNVAGVQIENVEFTVDGSSDLSDSAHTETIQFYQSLVSQYLKVVMPLLDKAI